MCVSTPKKLPELPSRELFLHDLRVYLILVILMMQIIINQHANDSGNSWKNDTINDVVKHEVHPLSLRDGAGSETPKLIIAFFPK